jgi:hypothetical protein
MNKGFIALTTGAAAGFDCVPVIAIALETCDVQPRTLHSAYVTSRLCAAHRGVVVQSEA